MFDRERVSGAAYLPPWVRHEHMARYRFAAGFVHGKRVIDAASGDGSGAAIFAQSGAEQVDAFDVSAESVEQARAKHPLQNLSFHVGSVLSLPVAKRTADVFISLETIEHLDADREFLSEVDRVLKPDGVFICSTPNRLVTNPGARLSDRPWNRFHVREYSLSEFRGLLAERFAKVEFWGQNAHSRRRVQAMQRLAATLPRRIPLGINQALKLPRLLVDRPDRHRVVEMQPSRDYEYCVAVCRAPRIAT